MLKTYFHLLELKVKIGSQVDKELRKEEKRLRKLYKKWNKEFKNALFYCDQKKPGKAIKIELFYRGLDPIEAVDYLIKLRNEKGTYSVS